MRIVHAIAALAMAAACGNDHAPPDDAGAGSDHSPYTACEGDPASFVRQAFLALDGHRPRSQAEVDVYVDLFAAAKAQGADPKELVARAIMGRPELAERWVDVVMDAMHVQRVDIQNEAACWDQTLRASPADGALAQTLRDQLATGAGDGRPWTMLDLARSAIALDDVSPILRAQLFSMVAHPIPAANVGPVEAELARRADFGDTFDAGFLHRDLVCLACHTSERSVTDSDDPALDRFWPVPGLPEKAVYGMSAGVGPDRAHAVFRVDSFADGNGHTHPWGWTPACGEFSPPASVPDDLAGIDAQLASITGKRATVYDLEAALRRGFDALRGNGPPLAADGSIADPDTALAWLVTLKITEDVWKQVTGTSLTIANYFPRNEASSSLLYALATRFARSGFSLQTLLAASVETDFFNRKPAEAGCGSSPYTYPNVFDPWVIGDPDPVKRQNGPGDAVTALDARTLRSATNAALDWTAPPAASRFPDYGDTGCDDLPCTGNGTTLGTACTNLGQCCTAYHAACQQNGVLPLEELPFERGVGMFLRNSERGFRGLDFQARLVWENRYGTCARPAWVPSDFLDRLAAAGAADQTATAADLIAALKDRLIGEPLLTDSPERAALVALVGPLEQPASALTVEALRDVCGALVGSPQFLMMGIAGRGGDRPRLTPLDAGYDSVCAELALRGVAGRTITCTAGKLALQ